jgi:CarD family transcriptional regulator
VAEHKVLEFVKYRQNGICEIKRIVKQDFACMGEKEYFELSPVYDHKTVIFVPVDSEALQSEMLHVLSVAEIDEIIGNSLSEEILWISDNKERARKYTEILTEGNSAKILSLIKTVLNKKRELIENNKKLSASDLKILSSAQKMITEEFSFVLGIDKDEVNEYLVNKLNK